MTTLFGQEIDPDFDEAKEDRVSRVGMAFLLGVALSIIYLILGLPFATQVFQGLFATIPAYGSSFYADRQTNMRKLWFWKAVLATLPFHLSYLAVIFYSDVKLPELMMKAVVFVPVLMFGFAFESAVIFDRIVDRFKPREPYRPTGHRSEA